MADETAAAGEKKAPVDGPDAWDAHWQRFDSATQRNPAERMRSRSVLRGLALGEAPARVLDIGSGQGQLAAMIGDAYPRAEVLGLELSAAGVALAARRAPSARFLQWDLLGDRAPPERWAGWATHAVCSEVLEHVDDPVRLLRTAARFMSPGCRLVVTVPGGRRSAFDIHIGHRRHYDRAALANLLRGAGFEPVRILAVGFPFFNLYRLTVIARGRRLVQDVTAERGTGGTLPGTVRLAMRAFDLLFRLNLDGIPWGWQIVGTARLP